MKTAPTNRPASKLPRAIALSITAMLAMNWRHRQFLKHVV